MSRYYPLMVLKNEATSPAEQMKGGKRKMRVKAELVEGKDLKPGELFSSAGQSYWDSRDKRSIGEKVYIRTDTPLSPVQEEIYCITIDK